MRLQNKQIIDHVLIAEGYPEYTEAYKWKKSVVDSRNHQETNEAGDSRRPFVSHTSKRFEACLKSVYLQLNAS